MIEEIVSLLINRCERDSKALEMGQLGIFITSSRFFSSFAQKLQKEYKKALQAFK